MDDDDDDNDDDDDDDDGDHHPHHHHHHHRHQHHHHKDLAIELSRLWQKRATVIPILVGSLGCIKGNQNKTIQSLSYQLLMRFSSQYEWN